MLAQIRRSAACAAHSTAGLLCTRLAAHSSVVRLGGKLELLRIANEFVPVVLARPMVVNIGLVTTTFAAVCNSTAGCVDNADDEIDRTMRELLGAPEPLSCEPPRKTIINNCQHTLEMANSTPVAITLLCAES